MTEQRIIGICGYMGSGKSVVAEHLERSDFDLRPLAQVLKDMLRTFGLSEDQVRGKSKHYPSPLLGGHTPRHAMQTLGTEWGRGCLGPDVWLRAWWAKVETLPAIVCDDVRFANEADFIRGKGGIILQVGRPGHGPGQHASEELDFSPDLLVQNDHSKRCLELRVDQALAGYLRGRRA